MSSSANIIAPVCVVKCVFSDGKEDEIGVLPGETVLEAAIRVGVPLRSECQLGTCGTCKGKCLDGEFDLETDDGLTIMERQHGLVLTCVMRPATDCVIQFTYPCLSKQAIRHPLIRGTIMRLEMVCSTVCRLVIDLGSASWSFLPGQYINIEIPGAGITRSYSMTNAPSEMRFAEFFVRLLPTGGMSDYLRSSAKLGDEVCVSGPFGSFFLRETPSPILMVAGGTGLAPMLSMLQHLVDIGETHRPVVLLFGANSEADLFGLDRLMAMQSQFDSLMQESIVVHPTADWTGEVGHVTTLLRPEYINVGDVHVYLCGPPAMIESAEGWLLRHDVSDERIFAEKFLPSGG